MKKLILAALVAAAVSPAFSAQYYLMVPVAGRAAVNPISVTLGSASLPVAKTGLPYAGFDFKPWLSVTGDPAFTGSGVTWAIASGSIPAGMALNGDGTLTGTPSEAPNNYSFMVSATYKGVSGSGAYNLAVQSPSAGTFAPGSTNLAGLPSSNVFPDTGVNDYFTESMVLTNTGSTSLTVQSMGANALPFSLTWRGRGPTLPATLAPGASYYFAAQFRPTAEGQFAGTVQVTTAELGTLTVPVSGKAVYELPPVLSASNVNFGNVAVNTASATQTVTVTNPSATPSSVKLAAVQPQAGGTVFGQFNNSGSNCLAYPMIPAGGSCTVTLQFTPTVAGSVTYNLNVTTVGGSVSIPVTGNGI